MTNFKLEARKFWISTLKTVYHTEPSKHKFRTSSLPYCGILHEYNIKKAKPRNHSYESNFYFKIGTAVHSLWQAAMSGNKQARAFGGWKCSECKKKLKPQLKPTKSCCPDSHWIYRELHFKQFPLSGHSDYLVHHNDHYAVWELKTSGLDPIQNANKGKGNLPYAKHVIQVETYCVLAEEEFNIRPEYYHLLYVSREKPNVFYLHTVKWTDKRRKMARKRLVGYIRQHDVPLKDKIQYRPCYTREDYWDKFGPKLNFEFEKGQCPMLDRCTSGRSNKQLLNELSKVLQ